MCCVESYKHEGASAVTLPNAESDETAKVSDGLIRTDDCSFRSFHRKPLDNGDIPKVDWDGIRCRRSLQGLFGTEGIDGMD